MVALVAEGGGVDVRVSARSHLGGNPADQVQVGALLAESLQHRADGLLLVGVHGGRLEVVWLRLSYHKSSPARALERAVLCADAHTHLMGRAAQAAASWVGAAAPGGGDEDGDVLELRCTSISYIKCQRRRPPLTHTLGHEVTP